MQQIIIGDNIDVYRSSKLQPAQQACFNKDIPKFKKYNLFLLEYSILGQGKPFRQIEAALSDSLFFSLHNYQIPVIYHTMAYLICRIYLLELESGFQEVLRSVARVAAS